MFNDDLKHAFHLQCSQLYKQSLYTNGKYNSHTVVTTGLPSQSQWH